MGWLRAMKPSSPKSRLSGLFKRKGPRDPLSWETWRHAALVAVLAWAGVGADSLSSANYGPEEAYKALLVTGDQSLVLWLAPMTAITVIVMAMAYVQIIALFPSGGGGYKAATHLVHPYAGLLSGSALVVDYSLTIAISVAAASDALLIPLQAEYYALEGLAGMMETVERVQGGLNPRLKVLGVVLTMFDGRTNLSQEVESMVRQHFGELVFWSVVPRNVRLSEAPSHGLPALIYDHRCPGSEAYMALARELLRRLPDSDKVAA